MKANEFVKKHGWDDAIYFLAITANVGLFCEPKLNLVIHQSITEPTHSGYDFVFHRDDLKRLVESHELVSKATPEELYQAEICEGIWCNHRLAQAIADVESCNVD